MLFRSVQTARGRALFSKATGNLLVLTDARGRELYNGQTNPGLFALDRYDGDTRRDLSFRRVNPAAGQFTERDGTGVWSFLLEDGLKVELQAGAGPQDTVELKLRLKNESKQPVALKAFFPELRGMLTGPSVRMFYPMFTGQVLNNLGGQRFQTEMVYPGHMASRWVTVADGDRGGLSFGAFDAEMPGELPAQRGNAGQTVGSLPAFSAPGDAGGKLGTDAVPAVAVRGRLACRCEAVSRLVSGQRAGHSAGTLPRRCAGFSQWRDDGWGRLLAHALVF